MSRVCVCCVCCAVGTYEADLVELKLQADIHAFTEANKVGQT